MVASAPSAVLLGGGRGLRCEEGTCRWLCITTATASAKLARRCHRPPHPPTPPARAKPWAPLDWAPGPRARWRQGPWPQTRAWESPHQPPNHPSFGTLFGPGTTWGPAGYFHVSQMATDLCFCYEWRHTLYAVHTSCKTERESAVVCNRLQLACPGAATGLERPRSLQSLYRGLQGCLSRSNKDAEQRRQSR